MKFDKEEKALMKSIENDEWTPVKNVKSEIKTLVKVAQNTLTKDQRMNIRISKHDMESLRVRAMEEGLPYQTLVFSILHKDLSGKLKERMG